MNDKLDIKCAKCFDKHLLFYRPAESTVNGETLRVSIKSNNVNVWLWVNCNYRRLIEFFREMACDWKGWGGEKVFCSDAGEMELKASTDRLGHVRMSIKLSARNPNFSRWDLETSVVIEAGRLELLSREIKMFLGGG